MDITGSNELESIINYSFKDKALLASALTHSSYANEHKMTDNERLEFLGDAVLELVSSDFIFRKYSGMPEGKMTRLRASIVCEPTLALCAREICLDKYILLGHGEDKNGGRNRDSIISDALEALIGAVYLDGGIEIAKVFIENIILNDIENKQLFFDSKTFLQEIVREKYGKAPEYMIIDVSGPDHCRKYCAAVLLDGEEIGRGAGPTKKSAEQHAAYSALLLLKQKESK